MYFLLKKFGFSSPQLCFFFRGVVVFMLFYRTFLMAQSCWCDLFSVKDEWPNLRGALQLWWFLLREVSPYTSGFGPLEVFCTLPRISPPENQSNMCWKIGMLWEDEADSFPAKKSGSFEKGWYSSTLSRGTVFRYLFTMGPWSRFRGASHPWGHRFGQHNSTSALGEVVRTGSTSSSRVAGGEDRCLDPQVPLWEGLN